LPEDSEVFGGFPEPDEPDDDEAAAWEIRAEMDRFLRPDGV